MSQLSNLTGAGRTDLVPGYVLSPPRLREQAIAEDAFPRWYLNRIERGTRKLNPELRQAMLRTAAVDVRDGYFTVGMPGYDAMAMSAKGTALMFSLSLRVKHPQVTSEEAGKLFDAADESKITAAVQELWGYGVPETKSDAPRTPIDWEPVYKVLMAPKETGGHDMTLEQVNDLAMGQVIALLGGDKSGRRPSIADAKEKARTKQHQMFDRICEMKSMTPAALGRLPAEIVAAYVREIIGDKRVDVEVLKGSLASYVEQRK